MSKCTKVWLWIATSVIVTGLILFGVVMTMAGWDFTKLNTVKTVTNEYAFDEEIRNIQVTTKITNVVFIPTQEECVRVVCKEQEKLRHSVSVENGTLVICVEDTRQWQDYIGVNFERTRITVYLPEAIYGLISVQTGTGDVNCFVSADKIQIKTETGNIFVEKIHAGDMELTVSTGTISAISVTCDGNLQADTATGRMNITNVHCDSFSSSGSTGDVILEQLIANQNIFIRRNTGDVKFVRCDANTLIRVEVDTGDVKGSLVTDKVFAVHTDTGEIDVPESVAGNAQCQISTGTGNVKITIHYE